MNHNAPSTELATQIIKCLGKQGSDQVVKEKTKNERKKKTNKQWNHV